VNIEDSARSTAINGSPSAKGVAALLADQFFLIAHEDRTGRSRLHPRATGLGLAASLIGELMAIDRVRAFDGDLYVVSREPPPDALSHEVLDFLLAQPQHREIRTWLAFLAQDAAVKVGERLLRAGVVEPVTRRKLRGAQTMYMPMSSDQRNTAAWAPARLTHILMHRQPMTVTDRLLAGLVVATGLTRHVLWDFSAHRQGLVHLSEVVDSLPEDLRQLVEHTEALIGSVLVAGRR
jgi:hypothetical protein